MKRWRDRFPGRMFLQVGGLDLHYERYGRPSRTKASVLMVHGLGDSTRTWRASARSLARLGFDVVAVDLRGSGYSERVPGMDCCTTTLVEELADFIDLLGLDRPAVCGVSYGGLLALLLAVRHPGRVGALVVCNALAYPEPINLPLDLKLARHPLLNPIGHWMMSRRALENTFRVWNFSDGWKGLRARVDEHWEQLNLPGGRKAFLATVKGVESAAVERASRLYPAIKARTLLLWGEREKWFPRQQGEKLAEAIEGAQLKIVKGGMHLFMEERPALFVKHAAPFLKRVLGSSKKKAARARAKTKRRVLRVKRGRIRPVTGPATSSVTVRR